MKSVEKIVLAILLVGGGFWIGSMFISNADGVPGSNEPGSVSDPVVTKSYVDEAIMKVLGGEIPQSANPGSGIISEVEGNELKIVKLETGFTLYADQGTELIVRNGRTVAVSDSVDGMADVTSGLDIKEGQGVENNHLLVSPAEGRGIKPEASIKGTIYVMVRGAYELEQE